MNYFRPEIVAMSGYTPGEQPQDDGFVKLNTNENPYPPSPRVAEAVAAALPRLNKYPDPTAGAFRRTAAEVLGLDPNWILCGNGSDDVLTIVTRALVGPGEAVRYPYPTYILYRTLAQLQGARFEEVLFQSDWTLPTDFAAEAEGVKLVYLANPNSPSGTMIAPDDVLRLAERLPCPLLVDEAYADFADTNCLHLPQQCDRIMVSRTLSKSYALAGLRFGFLVARPELIEQFVKVKDSYNCDGLSIAAAAAALADQAWLAEHRAKLRATRARLTVALRDLGFVTVESQANFTWNTHPTEPARPIYEELKRQRILVRYMDYPRWGDGLRITVGTDAEIDCLIDRLRKIV